MPYLVEEGDDERWGLDNCYVRSPGAICCVSRLYDLAISLSLLADKYTWKIDRRSLRPNGNVGQRVMPQEPMAIIMNFGISNSFAQVFLANLAELLPATMRIDYIRVHQDSSQVSVTCDPEGYEMTEYIRRHPEAFYVSRLFPQVDVC